MQLKNFNIYEDRVDLILEDDTINTIYLDENSGKVYCRFKTGTISDVKHPGIYFGRDQYGMVYYMHNHFETGRPAIVTEMEFTKGLPIHFYRTEVTNNPLQIIRKGLEQVLSGEPYTALFYNCQSFVNKAANNRNISEDVTKWAGRILGGLVVFGIIAAFNDKPKNRFYGKKRKSGRRTSKW